MGYKELLRQWYPWPHFPHLLEALGAQLDDLWASWEQAVAELFLATASAEGLRYWETMYYGLPANEQAPLESRRTRILAKLRGFSSGRRADIERVIASLVSGYFDVLEYPALYAFCVRVAWDKVADPDVLMNVLAEVRPSHLTFSVVGIPDRMLLLNHAGAPVVVTQALSWQETKTWKVFTGPRLNAAGPVETVAEDTSWSETITFKTFIGPRLNGPSLKLNGTGKANEGPTVSQQQTIAHPGSRAYKRFVAPVAAFNARGAVIEDVVDHGWDETITKHRFTGPRLNSPPTLTVTGQARLNAGPKTSEQVVVHHPVLEITVKNDGGTIFNRGATETRLEIINHPDVRTYKKFNPEAGMILNGKPVLGYMWKKELKEAV